MSEFFVKTLKGYKNLKTCIQENAFTPEKYCFKKIAEVKYFCTNKTNNLKYLKILI